MSDVNVFIFVKTLFCLQVVLLFCVLVFSAFKKPFFSFLTFCQLFDDNCGAEHCISFSCRVGTKHSMNGVKL